jgi:methylase of polypeptide subunit release factors
MIFDRLVAQAANYLVPAGYLILEIGAPQHEPARQRLLALNQYELADTVYDGSRHPRVLIGRKVG